MITLFDQLKRGVADGTKKHASCDRWQQTIDWLVLTAKGKSSSRRKNTDKFFFVQELRILSTHTNYRLNSTNNWRFWLVLAQIS